VLSPEADEVITAEVASEFVFDSHGTVMSLSAALLEALTDAAGADGQQRLEDFEEFAAQQEIFLDE
jgi:DNA-binding MurR/RpiR family transcriptional regulator